MQQVINERKAEHEAVRARLYVVEKELKELQRREVELGGVIAALEWALKQAGQTECVDS